MYPPPFFYNLFYYTTLEKINQHLSDQQKNQINYNKNNNTIIKRINQKYNTIKERQEENE